VIKSDKKLRKKKGLTFYAVKPFPSKKCEKKEKTRIGVPRFELGTPTTPR
jgi:hypothetical protein